MFKAPQLRQEGQNLRRPQTSGTRSSADADNALDAKEAVPNKWRADGTHNTYQSQ